jgi:hypothetical protein
VWGTGRSTVRGTGGISPVLLMAHIKRVCINKYGHIRSDPYLHILLETLLGDSIRVPI